MDTSKRKHSIYVSPEMTRVLASRRLAHSLSYSQRLSTLLDRYAVMVRAHRPSLSAHEWQVLCDRLKTFGQEVPTALFVSMHAALMHSSGAMKHSQIDSLTNLSKKLERMSLVELVSIVDVVEQYWSAKSQGPDTLNGILNQSEERS